MHVQARASALWHTDAKVCLLGGRGGGGLHRQPTRDGVSQAAILSGRVRLLRTRHRRAALLAWCWAGPPSGYASQRTWRSRCQRPVIPIRRDTHHPMRECVEVGRGECCALFHLFLTIRTQVEMIIDERKNLFPSFFHWWRQRHGHAPTGVLAWLRALGATGEYYARAPVESARVGLPRTRRQPRASAHSPRVA